ncbi:ArnT family glycosyltransferase [Lacticaseibacillus jixiensis]|uniref:ArnT family glycosyltransferase n=1 Tax=Lacticaseibacillus jixiensis TaxID=3231926 RepID=UPI0036F3A7D5
MPRWVTRFFSITTALAVCWMLIALLGFPRIGVLYGLWRQAHSTKAILIVGAVALLIAIGLLLGGRRLVQAAQPLSTRTSWLILIGELIVFLGAFLLVLSWCGYRQPVDDARIVFQWLHTGDKVDVWTHPTWVNQYMYANPQNLSLAGIYWIFGRFFGTSFVPIIVAFVILQAAAVLFSFAAMKRLHVDNLVALLASQLWFLTLQVWWHAAIAYTDTLLVFFTVLTLYSFAGWIDRSQSRTKRNWSLLGACVFATLGFLSKGTGLIMILALSVYLLLANKRQWRLLFVLPFIALGVGNFAWHQGINASGVYPDTGYGQPNTHYLMMGLSHTPVPSGMKVREQLSWPVGIYAAADQQYSWGLLYKQRLSKADTQSKQLAAAKARLMKLSPKQLLIALNDKVSVVWGSGDAKASFTLVRGMKHLKRGNFLFTSKIVGTISYLWMTVGQLVTYLGILYAVVRRRKQPMIMLGAIFVSGYFAFMLLWEANPRYSLAIVPIAGLLIALAASKAEPEPADVLGIM